MAKASLSWFEKTSDRVEYDNMYNYLIGCLTLFPSKFEEAMQYLEESYFKCKTKWRYIKNIEGLT